MASNSFIATDVSISFIWHDGPWNDLLNNVRKGMNEALSIYRSNLRKTISRWGSTAIGPNLRLFQEVSPVNRPPFRQTSNLYNSIRIRKARQIDATVVFLGFPVPTPVVLPVFHGSVETDVPYAPTLEFGGASIPDPVDKPHTGNVLVGFDNTIIRTIAPRPAWVPTFTRTRNRMIDLVVSGASEGLNVVA